MSQEEDVSRSRKIGLENEQLIIEVKKVPGKGKFQSKNNSYSLHKPTDEGRWMEHYTVKKHKKHFRVRVKWDDKGPPIPAYLEFYSDSDFIKAVGFSKRPGKAKRHSKPMPCGECFSLCSDLTVDTNSAIVANHGKKGRYYFTLWLSHGTVKTKAKTRTKTRRYDPQIYNDGAIHPGEPGEEKG